MFTIPYCFALFSVIIVHALAAVVAFFVPLFTARYPRALFDFDVGAAR
jgi:hypothetical protein